MNINGGILNYAHNYPSTDENPEEGIICLGYDRETKQLWLGLDQKDWSNTNLNDGWNANTRVGNLESKLSKDESVVYIFDGVLYDGEGIQLDFMHPAVTLYRLIKSRNPNANLCLTGDYSNWAEFHAFSEDLNGVMYLPLPTSIPDDSEVKLAIGQVDNVTWEDSNWGRVKDDSKQIQLRQYLRINLR